MEKNELISEISYLNSKIYMLNNKVEEQQNEIETLKDQVSHTLSNFSNEKERSRLFTYEEAFKEIQFELNRHTVEVSDISEIVEKALKRI